MSSNILYNTLITVPQDLDITLREPIIDPNTGEQAIKEGTGTIDPESGTIIPGTEEIAQEDIIDEMTGEIIVKAGDIIPGSGTIDPDSLTLIPGTGELLWGDYVIGNEVAWEIGQILTSYTPDKTPGTDYINPLKLVHVQVDITDTCTDPLGYLEALFLNYGLEWIVVSMQTVWNTIPPVIDESDPENPIEITPALPEVLRGVDINTVSPFIQSRGSQTKEVNWLHVFDGQADWQSI